MIHKVKIVIYFLFHCCHYKKPVLHFDTTVHKKNMEFFFHLHKTWVLYRVLVIILVQFFYLVRCSFSNFHETTVSAFLAFTKYISILSIASKHRHGTKEGKFLDYYYQTLFAPLSGLSPITLFLLSCQLTKHISLWQNIDDVIKFNSIKINFRDGNVFSLFKN